MPTPRHGTTLTPEDQAILELLAEGMTNREIGVRLKTTAEIVKTAIFHIRHFYTTQGHDVSTRVRLANVYRETT